MENALQTEEFENAGFSFSNVLTEPNPPEGVGVLKGYGFSAVLVINRVSILAYFGHFGHK